MQRKSEVAPVVNLDESEVAPVVALDDVQNCVIPDLDDMTQGGCADDRLAKMDEADAKNLVLRTRGVLLGVAALYGTNFGSIKIMQESLDPSTAALLRFTLALGALSPFLRSTPKALWKPGIDIGMWVALGYVVQGVGLNNGSSASTSAFLCSLSVVICPLLNLLEGGAVASKHSIPNPLSLPQSLPLSRACSLSLSLSLSSLASTLALPLLLWSLSLSPEPSSKLEHKPRTTISLSSNLKPKP
jgi:hypothetical protein